VTAAAVVSTGSPGCQAPELHSGAGDGRSGADGGVKPRLGFCGTVAEPLTDPPADAPEPLEPVAPPVPLAEDGVATTRAVLDFEGSGVRGTAREAFGEGGDDGVPLLASPCGVAEPADGRSEPPGSAASPPSPAEHATAQKAASITAVHSETDRDLRRLRNNDAPLMLFSTLSTPPLVTRSSFTRTTLLRGIDVLTAVLR